MLGALYKFNPSHVDNGIKLVGEFMHNLNAATKTDHSVYWCKALQLDRTLSAFDWPDRGHEAELTSLKLQANKRVLNTIPDNDKLQFAINRLVNKYIKFDLSYVSFDYEVISHLVDKFLKSGCIKMDASPGVPFSAIFPTNKKFFEQSLEYIKHLVWSRIQLRLIHKDVIEPEQMVLLGLCDPVKVFVKQEPHSIDKIKEGRFRLIMSVSIIDKLVEMVLIKDLKDLEINNWYRIPSKPGMGFTDDMVSIIYNKVMQMNNPVSTDVSGWDWSVQQWMLDADADIMVRLCNNPFQDWIDLIKVTAKIEGSSVYCLSDSQLYTLSVPGNQNSGKLKTSMSNSRMRALMAFLVGSEDVICMGDDDVEEFVDNAEQKYAELGIKVKMYSKIDNEFEFCSKIYTQNGCYPTKYGKTLMKLLHQEPKSWEEYIGFMIGFIDEMCKHPEYERLLELIQLTGFARKGGKQMILDEDEL